MKIVYYGGMAYFTTSLTLVEGVHISQLPMLENNDDDVLAQSHAHGSLSSLSELVGDGPDLIDRAKKDIHGAIHALTNLGGVDVEMLDSFEPEPLPCLLHNGAEKRKQFAGISFPHYYYPQTSSESESVQPTLPPLHKVNDKLSLDEEADREQPCDEDSHPHLHILVLDTQAKAPERAPTGLTNDNMKMIDNILGKDDDAVNEKNALKDKKMVEKQLGIRGEKDYRSKSQKKELKAEKQQAKMSDDMLLSQVAADIEECSFAQIDSSSRTKTKTKSKTKGKNKQAKAKEPTEKQDNPHLYHLAATNADKLGPDPFQMIKDEAVLMFGKLMRGEELAQTSTISDSQM